MCGCTDLVYPSGTVCNLSASVIFGVLKPFSGLQSGELNINGVSDFLYLLNSDSGFLANLFHDSSIHHDLSFSTYPSVMMSLNSIPLSFHAGISQLH